MSTDISLQEKIKIVQLMARKKLKRQNNNKRILNLLNGRPKTGR